MKIEKKNIRKGFRFSWNGAYMDDYMGVYEIVCFTKDFEIILCYKPVGRKASIRTEELAKFDERIINNKDFEKIK